MLIRALIYFIILSFSVSGCVDLSTLTKPFEQPKSTTPPPDPTQTAKQLEAAGNYAGAAREYLNLAWRTRPPAQQTYRLAAVESYIRANLLAEAKVELASLQNDTTANMQIPIELSSIHIALAEQRVNEALRRLEIIDPIKLSLPLRIQHQQLYIQGVEAKGKVLDAVWERVQLDSLLNTDQVAIANNHQSLWRVLSTLNANELSKVSEIPGDVFSGWVALAVLAKNTPANRLSPAINEWQQRFPNHPASLDIVRNLLQPTAPTQTASKFAVSQPTAATQIALLLPLTGTFKAQSEAIRDGFFAALYAERSNQPNVTVYDTNANNVVQIYQQVVRSGANFVVGPLEKNALTALVNSQLNFPVPTLGLNYLEVPVSASNFYQFGLLPENEASEVAMRAWADGHRSAAILVQEGDWGNRVSRAFQAEWMRRGGQVVTTQTYGSKNLADAAKRAISKPTDMVFISATTQFGRQLRPYFKMVNETREIPIYSTSHIYSGTPTPQADTELNGVIFGDMPWVVAPDAVGAQLQASLQQQQSSNFSQFKRLYAMGIDAYYMLSHLQQIANQPLQQWQGQTGRLSLDNTRSIRRQLRWAQFTNGVPKVISDNALLAP